MPDQPAPEQPAAEEWLRTGIGTSTTDSITVCGRDVATEVMGVLSFTELAFLLATGRSPSAAEVRLFDAVLVSLADHGLTPTALAARLTYTGAPESLQGAIASGLLGAGSTFLGPVEDTVRFLDAALEHSPDGTALADVARGAVEQVIAEGGRVPGLGHPIHRVEDPRTPRLYALADELDLAGRHLALLHLVADAFAEAIGRRLPINGAGAAGAALADMAFPITSVRGSALLARVAGLVGHLQEESRDPIGMRLYREIDQRAVYDAESFSEAPER